MYIWSHHQTTDSLSVYSGLSISYAKYLSITLCYGCGVKWYVVNSTANIYSHIFNQLSLTLFRSGPSCTLTLDVVDMNECVSNVLIIQIRLQFYKSVLKRLSVSLSVRLSICPSTFLTLIL